MMDIKVSEIKNKGVYLYGKNKNRLKKGYMEVYNFGEIKLIINGMEHYL